MHRSTGNGLLQVSRACKTALFLLFVDQCGEKKALAPVPGTHETRYSLTSYQNRGTPVAQWLRCCVTNRKVAGSIPAGVSGFFIDIKYFRSHCGPGVDSASNRNEYQEYFLGVKAAGALD